MVTSLYDEGFNGTLNGSLGDKVAFDGIAADKVESLKLPTFDALNQLAMSYSDVVIAGSESFTEDTQAAWDALDCPKMPFVEAELGAAEVANFYDTILEGKEVAVEG